MGVLPHVEKKLARLVKQIKKTKDPERVRYLDHRKRVLEAEAHIDTHPPTLHAGNFLKLSRLKEDAHAYIRIATANVNLLKAVNEKMRTTGAVDNFRERTVGRESYTEIDKRRKYETKMVEIDKLEDENCAYGILFLTTQAKVETRHSTGKFAAPKRPPFIPPTKLLQKYGNKVKITRNKIILRRLLRPRLYLDLAVKHGRSLGRIVIQLYTEACPQVVLEFMRQCATGKTEKICITHLFPDLWLEGLLFVKDPTHIQDDLEFDMRALDNDAAGTLTFSKKNTKGFRHGYINFAISAKPLAAADGNRVPFGRVGSGMRVLNCVADYGTKRGRPLKEILVTAVGVFYK